jgi:hypothetical protein
VHRLKLIPLIFSNFGNFCKRFCSLWFNRKKAVPSLAVNPYQGKSKTSENRRSVIVEVRNGLILKINDSYIPIRKNEVHRRLHLTDFSGDTVEFELIGAMQSAKLTVLNNSNDENNSAIIQGKTLMAV